MVNNIGYTEKTLLTTIGLTTADILSEDITIISGEIGLGFLLFDLSGTIAVITAYENSNSFTLTTYATSYTIQAAVSTTATASDLVKGKTAYVKSGKITGTVRAFSSSESWPAGYYMLSKSSNSIKVYGKPATDALYRAGSRVYVEVSNSAFVDEINRGTAVLTPENVKKDITILGVTGTYEGATQSPVTYTTTVNNGTATPSTAVVAGTKVTITANTPEEGKEFDKWVVVAGDVILANETENETTFTMGMANVEVTATYKDLPSELYTLTVYNGETSGTYNEGDSVDIYFVPPEDGGLHTFNGWQGDVTDLVSPEGIEFDTMNEYNTIAMPAKNITLYGTYTSMWDLQVINGSPSGFYSEGESITVDASTIEENMIFVRWEGDTEYLSDSTAQSTELTMPASNVTITAIFEPISE